MKFIKINYLNGPSGKITNGIFKIACIFYNITSE